MREEREDGGGKEIDSIYCGPTGCSRATPVRPVTPRVQPVKLYRKYRLGVGKTENLDNSNKETISVEPT
jgi:hypothetical protein